MKLERKREGRLWIVQLSVSKMGRLYIICDEKCEVTV